ncbi:AcrR family transcriptional regulator [Paraburkholderia sp. GAS199]|uniref:TetR/AcrR family transcriptional regulator n=1 Tax=Paraburkholderia sp. GAS199 TaxID=3035126 RepID=UPI003D25407E
MNLDSAAGREPRKTPRQARSVVTVDTVFEATLQVLLSDGPRRLTTTRVAQRAGVSVGTIYQYYPNKEALLVAVLERHLDHVAETVEAACLRQHGGTLDSMIEALVHAFVEAKTARMEESRALYAIAAELNTTKLVMCASERLRAAAIAMLDTAQDAKFADLPMVAFMWLSAMVGPTRAILEGRAPPKMLRALRAQLVLLSDAYLKCVAVAASEDAAVSPGI